MSPYNLIYAVLLLASLVSCLVKFSFKEFYAKMVIFYLIGLLCVFVASIYLVRVAGLNNNLFLFHIATPVEYTVLGLLYYGIMVKLMVKQWILFSIPVFVLLSIFFSLFVQKIDVSNTYSIIISSTLLSLWSLFFLREVLLFRPATRLLRFPMFWISAGVLFYYTGSLLIEGMLNFMMDHNMPLAQRLYRIVYIFKYLLFILFIISAFCQTAFKTADEI